MARTGFAEVAQLVEQRTENPRVTGSNPVLGILFLPGALLYQKGRTGFPCMRTSKWQ